MPIRINATQPRSVGNNTSTRTTGRRSFNRNSYKKGRRNFNRKRNNNTFEQRNSLSAYIAKAQTKPRSANVDKDGFTVVGSRNITMRTPARRSGDLPSRSNDFVSCRVLSGKLESSALLFGGRLSGGLLSWACLLYTSPSPRD